MNAIKVTRKEEYSERLSTENEPNQTDAKNSTEPNLTQPTTQKIKSVVLDHLNRESSENYSKSVAAEIEKRELKQRLRSRESQSVQHNSSKRNDEVLLSWAENSYKTWSKNLILLGAGLAQAKELRDLFEDVLGMVADPLR